MNRVNIKFSSVTHAFRAKEIIEQNGGKAIVRKTASSLKNEGCGYSVIVTGNINKIMSLLKINKVSYIGYVFL